MNKWIYGGTYGWMGDHCFCNGPVLPMCSEGWRKGVGE